MFSVEGIVKIFVQALIIMVMIFIIKKIVAALPLPQAIKNVAEEV
jgi:hypothetical protein